MTRTIPCLALPENVFGTLHLATPHAHVTAADGVTASLRAAVAAIQVDGSGTHGKIGPGWARILFNAGIEADLDGQIPLTTRLLKDARLDEHDRRLAGASTVAWHAPAVGVARGGAGSPSRVLARGQGDSDGLTTMRRPQNDHGIDPDARVGCRAGQNRMADDAGKGSFSNAPQIGDTEPPLESGLQQEHYPRRQGDDADRPSGDRQRVMPPPRAESSTAAAVLRNEVDLDNSSSSPGSSSAESAQAGGRISREVSEVLHLEPSWRPLSLADIVAWGDLS